MDESEAALQEEERGDYDAIVAGGKDPELWFANGSQKGNRPAEPQLVRQ